MKPPGKTTLARMQRTAMLEAERIEISQDHWIREGRIKEPMPQMVETRDDYAGIVRLIDLIMSDQVLLDRLQQRMAEVSRANSAAPAPKMVDPDKDIAVDAEAEA
jgi:hypothetical protein